MADRPILPQQTLLDNHLSRLSSPEWPRHPLLGDFTGGRGQAIHLRTCCLSRKTIALMAIAYTMKRNTIINILPAYI